MILYKIECEGDVYVSSPGLEGNRQRNVCIGQLVPFPCCRCKRIATEHPSTVLEKFIGFLEDALDEEGSEDEDDDE